MKPVLTLLDRTLKLARYPQRKNETLQAWDAADEYLINHTHDIVLDPQRPILIFNDSFGALSCWLAEKGQVTSISDSYVAQQGCSQNLAANELPAVTQIDCLADLPANPQLVLIKLPKSNRLLTWQLQQLCHLVPEDCVIIGAGKAKEIHTSTLKLCEKYLGETKTSLAVKKARLVFIKPDKSLAKPMPTPKTWDVPEHEFTLANHANVFSGESLDIGGRFLLDHIPQDPNLKHIIDLGCGNGVISLKAAKLNPQAKVTSVDESYMAVASCGENAKLNLDNPEQIHAIVNNCLDGLEAESADMVLCNPPFHQQNAVTDHIAWQMFCDAQQVLRPNGQLIVIGNRQLGYDEKMKRIFGNVQKIAQNNKFIIYKSGK
ncbi:methyltransferase [Photobacterium sanguinicancri]|uniref:methyltransferase n=1 Tax=Photobacterium sanguinicancri TaxID=875932 RepID=UPI0026E22A59|nr:methyltransferase [Photobacterium sanguinicancri]MDO6497620.1 methyltransferase [Photobacterium sanguinicancri]